MIIGTPDIVEQKITALADNFQVDEIVIATFANTFEDRIRSYELLAERFKLKSNVSAIADTEGPTS